MNARIALGAGALAVTALVVVLVVKIRESPDDDASAAAPATARGEPAAEATGTAPAPERMSSAGAADASALPTPAEVADSRARVEAEHVRSPSHAPYILDNNLQAQPLKEARRAMQKGDYETALAAAEDALSVEPDSNNARVMAVMAACSMGSASKAQAHADKLDDMRKSRVAVRCQKFGIEIKGAKPIDPEE